MADEIATTQHWLVTFNYKGKGDTATVLEALATQGWSPSIGEPDDNGWRVVTCYHVEAERADEAEGLVSRVASAALPSSPAFDNFSTDPTLTGSTVPVGGTWTGAGDADDFTVSDTFVDRNPDRWGER